MSPHPNSFGDDNVLLCTRTPALTIVLASSTKTLVAGIREQAMAFSVRKSDPAMAHPAIGGHVQGLYHIPGNRRGSSASHTRIWDTMTIGYLLVLG